MLTHFSQSNTLILVQFITKILIMHSFPSTVLGRGMKRSFSSAMRSPVIPVPPVLPVGFKFNPSDEELIGYYLVMLLNGLYSNEMPIGIVNFLEFDPWELPGLSRVSSLDQVWYFFCQRVVYMDRKKRMYSRKTRTGHWSPTGESTIIESLGKRSTLRFYKDSPKRLTEWKAYEYEIAPNSMLPNPGEFVVIKLMNSSGTKMKTNSHKQKLRNTLTSPYDESGSLDEVMTTANCYSHEGFADFGNQNVGNTTVSPTYSLPQQCEKDTVPELIPPVSYGSYVVSSDFGHENPNEMAVISTYGESSSQATSGGQNHSSVSPYIPENQEDCILASDFENQNLPSEVETTTPDTENQLTTDETNLSCSMTSRLEDHFQNQEFNSPFLTDGIFRSRIDLDREIADLSAFRELLNCLYPTRQQPTCLDQCM